MSHDDLGRRERDRRWLDGEDDELPAAELTRALDDEPPAGATALPRAAVSRRGALGAAALVVAAGAGALAWRSRRQGGWRPGPGGKDDGEPHAKCVDGGSLPEAGAIGAARIIYDETAKPRPMRFDEQFLGQLGRWLDDWNATSRYRGVDQVWSYGAWVVKGDCASWHAEGRAFDISRLRRGGENLVSARHDLWQKLPEKQRVVWHRRYWTLAASLNLHCAYVLSYHFDDAHQNHLHVDNGISGAGMSRFNPESRVQNQSVQEICGAIWGRPGEITGHWADTQQQVGPVLAELGVRDLTKQATWQAFLRASVKRG